MSLQIKRILRNYSRSQNNKNYETANKFDQLNFPRHWKEFKYKTDKNIIKLEESRCYWNSIETANKLDVDLCCGVVILFNKWFEEDYQTLMNQKDAIVKPFYYVFPHAWNFDGSKIIDTTLRDSQNYTYFGETVDRQKFNDGHQLLYLNRQMKR